MQPEELKKTSKSEKRQRGLLGNTNEMLC